MHGSNTRNSLSNHLYLKLAKRHDSPFIFYDFSSIKSENNGETSSVGMEDEAAVGRGRW
jgi:hypothetical protein